MVANLPVRNQVRLIAVLQYGTLLHLPDANNSNSSKLIIIIRKEDKYVDLGDRYIFEPIAVETLGVFNASARHLLADLGRRISINTGDARETSSVYFNGFLFWCSALMLFCCMTVCRQLTARTDDRTHLCIA